MTTMTIEEFKAMRVPTIIETVNMTVSDDEESKKAKESHDLTVKFTFTGFTGQDLIDTLMGASSPRVRYQNAHRPKGVFPKEWDVPKPGRRATAIVLNVDAMDDDALSAYLKKNPELLARLLKMGALPNATQDEE